MNWTGKYWTVGSTCCHSVLSDRSLWTQTLLGTGSSSATRSPGTIETVGTLPIKTKRNRDAGSRGVKSHFLNSWINLNYINKVPPPCHFSSSGCICPRSDGQPSPTPSAPNSESQWGCDSEGPTWAALMRILHSLGLGLPLLCKCRTKE